MTAELNQLARRATVHCLTGCGIGEVLGMVIGTGLHWSNTRTMILAIVLAFGFGDSLTIGPLLKAGIPPARAASLTAAADTASITLMEVAGTRGPGSVSAQSLAHRTGQRSHPGP